MYCNIKLKKQQVTLRSLIETTILVQKCSSKIKIAHFEVKELMKKDKEYTSDYIVGYEYFSKRMGDFVLVTARL